PPRGPQGPSPGHVACRHSSEGALAASPQGHVEAPRGLAAAPTSSTTFPEVARVLLLALVTSAGAPTPSGGPALRFGWPTCSPPRALRRHGRQVGLRPASLKSLTSPRVALRAGGRSKEVVRARTRDGSAEGAPANQRGRMAMSKAMRVHFVARENGPERLVT